jgi:hypothetical protein
MASHRQDAGQRAEDEWKEVARLLAQAGIDPRDARPLGLD